MVHWAGCESLPGFVGFVPIWGLAMEQTQEECEVAAKGRTKTPSLGLGHQVMGFLSC